MARVLLFGRLADIAGWREREIDLSTVDALRRALCEADPGLAEALGAPGSRWPWTRRSFAETGRFSPARRWPSFRP